MNRTTIHLDAVGGVAGDMFVAAMLDALPELRARVLADTATVLPPGAGTPTLDAGMSGSLRCLRFRLAESELGTAHPTAHGHGAPHHGTDGSFGGMVARIEGAALAPGTAAHAVAILRHLAEAEATIHDVPLDQVHFHEIADWDSLMDVVAAGSISASLADTHWTVSDLPRGGGLVRTQHGLLPVPAPATALLLQGFRWRDDGVAGERVTPTGAAILRHLVAAGPQGSLVGRLRGTGTGAGTRHLSDMPNVLRVSVFEAAPQTADQREAEDVAVLSFDVDDMTGEEIGIAADRLRGAQGVRDLVILPGFGKKGRPVHVFQLLLHPRDREAVVAACFAETSTIGLRWRLEQRAVLPRRPGEFRRAGLSIRVKTVDRGAGQSHKAESDDLAKVDGLEARRAIKRLAEEGL